MERGGGRICSLSQEKQGKRWDYRRKNVIVREGARLVAGCLREEGADELTIQTIWMPQYTRMKRCKSDSDRGEGFLLEPAEVLTISCRPRLEKHST